MNELCENGEHTMLHAYLPRTQIQRQHASVAAGWARRLASSKEDTGSGARGRPWYRHPDLLVLGRLGIHQAIAC